MDKRVRFGPFDWCPLRRQLLADGEQEVELGARAFDLLGVLIDNRDRVMSKGDLLSQVWPDTIVAENNLTVQVSTLRKVLGDTAITTVPGRGYKWSLPVEMPAESALLRRSKPSIAVLPFANQSGEDGKDYFADGLTEDIVASLSHSPWIFVVASSSSMQYRDTRMASAEVCRMLGVQYLLRGTLRHAGQRIRIAVELIHGNSDEVVWADRYSRPAADLFDVQDEVAARIVGTLEPAFLKREEQRAATRADRDLQHWDLLMRARWHFWRSSKRHSLEAKRLLEQALTRRPTDVATLSLLAFSLATDVWSGWANDARGTALEARQLAMRAVALDDSDAFAHFTLGVTLLGFGELDAAIAEQRRALALYPHFAAAAAELGRLLAFSGETGEGARLTHQAIADSPSDPRMPLWVFGLGIADFVDGRPAEAATHARTAITLRRDWFFNHLLLATSLAHQDEMAGARSALAEGLRLLPTLSLAALRVGHPFRHAADRSRYIRGLRAAGWHPPDIAT